MQLVLSWKGWLDYRFLFLTLFTDNIPTGITDESVHQDTEGECIPHYQNPPIPLLGHRVPR